MSNPKLPAIIDNRDAMKVLGDSSSKRIAYATTLYRLGNVVFIKHHDTDIVEYHADGSVFVRNGGFHTRATADRLNRLTPDVVHVFIRQGIMYVDYAGSTIPLYGWYQVVEPRNVLV